MMNSPFCPNHLTPIHIQNHFSGYTELNKIIIIYKWVTYNTQQNIRFPYLFFFHKSLINCHILQQTRNFMFTKWQGTVFSPYRQMLNYKSASVGGCAMVESYLYYCSKVKRIRHITPLVILPPLPLVINCSYKFVLLFYLLFFLDPIFLTIRTAVIIF